MTQYNKIDNDDVKKIFKDFGITGICFDSRKIKEGDIFVAIKGENFNGNDFIDLAIKLGARILITDDLKVISSKLDSRIIYVENARIALSIIAGILYPNLPKYLIAVTGTNGKTSIVSYCHQLYRLLNQNSASIGTMGLECDSIAKEVLSDQSQHLTTLDPLTFRSILHNLANNNIDYVAFEASSHGLVQERLYDIKVQAAAFSSLSQDHLDYHKTMDNYLEAKLKLFKDNLSPDSVAIINSEIKQSDLIKDCLIKYKIDFLTVGMNGDAQINQIKSSIFGQEIAFTYGGKNYNFDTEIISNVQSSNLLIAALLVHKTGFKFEDVMMQLPKIRAVSGRLERVTDNNHPYHILVDYAHTPDALSNSLNELKKIKPINGKLKVIFGCGGNRDRSKRGLMGEIASRISDEVIITDDNPRYENPSAIRKEILESALNAKETPNRKEAIINTINELQEDDILLIAGKGHENYQIIGDTKIEFSDVCVAKEVIKNLYHREK